MTVSFFVDAAGWKEFTDTLDPESPAGQKDSYKSYSLLYFSVR